MSDSESEVTISESEMSEMEKRFAEALQLIRKRPDASGIANEVINLFTTNGLFENVLNICKYKPVATIESNGRMKGGPFDMAEKIFYERLIEFYAKIFTVATDGLPPGTTTEYNKKIKPVTDMAYNDVILSESNINAELEIFKKSMSDILTSENGYLTRFDVADTESLLYLHNIGKTAPNQQVIYYEPTFLKIICDIFGFTIKKGLDILSIQNDGTPGDKDFDLKMTFIELAFGDYVGLASSGSVEEQIEKLKSRDPECLEKVCQYFNQITSPLSDKEREAKALADSICPHLGGTRRRKTRRYGKRRYRNSRYSKRKTSLRNRRHI